MSTNLPGGVAIGQYDTCLLRVGRLDENCAPVYGANAGIITFALVDMTASPEIKTGEAVELENGCGDLLVNLARQDKVKYRNLSGNLGIFDWEMLEILFGGSLNIFDSGHARAGEVSGWNEPGVDDADRNPVALEVIVRNAGKGFGACTSSGSDFPPYTGYIFPKCFLTVGDRAFAKGVHQLAFTGKSEQNPNYGSGPWRDWDDINGVGTFSPTTPMATTSYDTLPLNGLSAATVGYLSTPASS